MNVIPDTRRRVEVECERCGGTGRVPMSGHETAWGYSMPAWCSACNGTGIIAYTRGVTLPPLISRRIPK